MNATLAVCVESMIRRTGLRSFVAYSAINQDLSNSPANDAASHSGT